MSELIFQDEELMHYGVGHLDAGKSGRYPWGSGDDPYQRNKDFYAMNKTLIREGYSEKERALYFFGEDGTTDQLRKMNGLAKDQIYVEEHMKILEMKEHGYSNTYIAETLGVSEGTVRNHLKATEEGKINKTNNCAQALKDELMSGKEYLDVSAGAEYELNVSDQTLKKALTQLKEEGYNVYTYKQPQVTNETQKTTMLILCPPDVTYGEFINNTEGIASISTYFPDYDSNFKKIEYPASMDSKRVYIDYGDAEGNNSKDGVIDIRRNVADLSLGDSSYAQVRIMVDDKFYMKGVALYSDNVPDGYDVVYHTNKKPGTPVMNEDPEGKSVMKMCKIDTNGEVNKAMPFGTTIKAGGQSEYDAPDGTKKLSLINKVNEEGDWGEWSRTVASQMLSKQPEKLIDKQLKLSLMSKQSEFDEINALTNPTVKKKLLLDFAEECDGNAVDLKAVAFPRQTTKLLLPVPSLKDNEIYCPEYKDGEEVCLIRYPHAGTFEIPKLTVNNKNPEGTATIGPHAKDACGINPKVAEKLSGADFDGDTAVVIPLSKSVNIKVTNTLIKDFNPKELYPEVKGMKVMTSKMKGKKMGEVTNLITDMTLQGAPLNEIERAVKHSMVVIDSEKHRLNYEASYADNGIQELKNKYQPKGEGKEGGGAFTLISKSKSPEYVNRRKEWNASEYKGEYEKETIDINTGEVKTIKVKTQGIDPSTGRKVYKDEAGYTTRDGQTKYYKQRSNKMTEALIRDDNAYSLISSAKNPKEIAYAEFATSLHQLANTARKTYLETIDIQYSPSAAKKYKAQVDKLDADLMIAKKNAPRERAAQRLAKLKMDSLISENPELADDAHKAKKKKLAQQALTEARNAVGAKKKKVVIDDDEWEAIQAGAISKSKLSDILENADMDSVKKRAMPKSSVGLTAAQESRIRAYAAQGHTLAEIADYLHLSTSTISGVLSA